MTKHEHTYENVESEGGKVVAERCRVCSFVRPVHEIKEVVQVPWCEWCGADFTPVPGDWINIRFCSKDCYDEDLEDRKETGRAISRKRK